MNGNYHLPGKDLRSGENRQAKDVTFQNSRKEKSSLFDELEPVCMKPSPKNSENGSKTNTDTSRLMKDCLLFKKKPK